MMQNPLVQTVLLFFGAYSVMTILKRKEPFGMVLTVLAGLFAVVIWMLRYNRAGLHSLYQNPLFKPVIDLICQMTGEQPPVDASVNTAPAAATAAPSQPAPASGPARPRAPVSARSYSAAGSAPATTTTGSSTAPTTKSEATPLMLTNEGDFTIAAHQIGQRLFGMRSAIDQTLLQLRRNLRLREKSAATMALPPVGLFLLIGKQGLGKRTLALEIGRRLYRGDSVGVVDLAEPDSTMEAVIASAKSNPFQTFVLENIDKAPPRLQNDLLTIVAGQPLSDSTGSRISFKHCCFFLLMHKDAGEMKEPTISSEQGGFTVATDRLAGDTSLDRMLAQGLHGVIPFHLPDMTSQAEVVAHLMEEECKKFQLTLGSISPALLAREVQEISNIGNFSAAPMRVSRVLSRSIHHAMDRQQTTVEAV